VTSLLKQLYGKRPSRDPQSLSRDPQRPKPSRSSVCVSLHTRDGRETHATFSGCLDTRTVETWLKDFIGLDTVPMDSVYAQALLLGHSSKDIDVLVRERYIKQTVQMTGRHYVKAPKR
jgi:hypothetical protein